MKDWRGITYDSVRDPIARDGLATISDFLFQLSPSIARIASGERPDSSGRPLIPLDDYFYLPGRSGNQTGYGGTGAGGFLTLSSTKNATKGKIYLGSALNSAVDEVNNSLGIGTAAPTATGHFVGNPQPTLSRVVIASSSGDSNYSNSGAWETQPTGSPTNMIDVSTCLRTDDDASAYLSANLAGAVSRIASCKTDGIFTPGSTYTVRFRARIVGSVLGTVTFSVGLVGSDGIAYSGATTFTPGTQFSGSWAYYTDTVTLIGGTGSGLPTNSVRVLCTNGSTQPERVDCSYVEVLNGTPGAIEAITIVERTASTTSPYSIWRNELDASVATITSAGGATLTSNLTVTGTSGQTGSFLDIFNLSPNTSIFGVYPGIPTNSADTTSSHVRFGRPDTGRYWWVRGGTTPDFRLDATGNSRKLLVLNSVANYWTDTVETQEFRIGDAISGVRSGAFIGEGGARFDRLGISTSHLVIAREVTTALPAPSGTNLVRIYNGATAGSDALVPLKIESARAGQTGDLLQVNIDFHDTIFRIKASGTAEFGNAVLMDGPQIIVKGADVQTQNMVEVYNGSGDVLTSWFDSQARLTTISPIRFNPFGTGVYGSLVGTSVSVDRIWTLPNATGTGVFWNAGVAGRLPLAGSLLYGAGINTAMSELAIGANGTILSSSGSAPQWSTVASLVDVARTWTTLQTFRDTTWKIVDDGDATKTAIFSLGGASAGADLTLAWAGTADRTVTFPNATGTLSLTSDIDVVRTWATLQTFKDTTFKVVDDGDSTKTAVFSLGGASAGADLTLEWAGTADRTITFPDVTTKLAALENAVAQTWTSQNVIDVGAGGTLTYLGGPTVSLLGWEDTDTGFFIEILAPATALTGSSQCTLPPNISGDIILSGGAQTISGAKTFGTSAAILKSNTASSGCSFADNTTDTKRLRMVLSGAVGNNSLTFSNTAARTYTFINDSATMLGIVAPTSATVDKTGQTASIAATTTYTTTHAGFYRMSAYWVFTAVTTPGTLTVTAHYTDPQQAQTNAFINAVAFGAAGAYAQGACRFYATSGTTIQFSTTLVNTGTYNVYVRVESLS